MSHIVTVIALNTKITTAYNFEKSTFSTNDVPNNTCSRPDANSADPDQTAPLAAKSLQKNKFQNVKIIRAVFQILYFNINVVFFSVLPVFIVVKHRRHLGSSGDEGCLDEDDKITSGYRSGNWNATA